MKFHYVRISLIREKDWYEIRDVLVPILIDIKFTKYEFYLQCAKYPNCHGTSMLELS